MTTMRARGLEGSFTKQYIQQGPCNAVLGRGTAQASARAAGAARPRPATVPRPWFQIYVGSHRKAEAEQVQEASAACESKHRLAGTLNPTGPPRDGSNPSRS